MIPLRYMNRPHVLLIAGTLLLSCVASAQSFQPKTIQFKGDSEHSDAELATAAGLKTGMELTAASLNDHTKLLMDSGIFDNITFSYKGGDLVFQIVPATDVYPLRLENFPMASGKELDDKLHARFPLYHGKVPTQGGLLDDVRKELEAELASKGIQATIAAAPFEDQKLGKVTAINLSISNPPVRVGQVELKGTSSALADQALSAAAGLTGSPYSVDGSVSQLETRIGNFYHERGYLEAAAHATAVSSAVADEDGVQIPFTVTVDEGPQYKLAGVQLAPGLVVTQADFDRQSNLHSGEIISPEKLRTEWAFLVRQYHNKGMMKARVLATASFDRARATVSYTITAEGGPVYTMGVLKVDNVADDLRAAILKAWPIKAGDTFDEGAILGLAATHGVDPALERVFANVNLRYALNLHDDVRTVDVLMRLERKH